MKMYNLCFFAVASLICFSAFADNKLYISTNNIMIADNGIFVKIDGYVFKTNNIFQDETGTYLIDFETKICPVCGRHYPGYEKECPFKAAH